ncbi:aminotransferase class V-fold PLP-dependent enzyme [Picosynechococcus sp. PCC 11901]|uniref:aminotransferase class V-fold PLP-dependent enzyme n=1 Tax=Picosynechococcus sp. PCC 11901 TaxID=2579791 RepID=UPI0026B30798
MFRDLPRLSRQTPVDPRVAETVMAAMMTQFGNASSVDHVVGDRSREAVAQAKQEIADLVNCRPKEIIFTSAQRRALISPSKARSYTTKKRQNSLHCHFCR